MAFKKSLVKRGNGPAQKVVEEVNIAEACTEIREFILTRIVNAEATYQKMDALYEVSVMLDEIAKQGKALQPIEEKEKEEED